MEYYTRERIEKLLEEYPQYREKLFCRGFLITDRADIDLEGYPFYGNWSHKEVGEFNFLVHNEAKLHTHGFSGDKTVFLIGHAYNPYTMEHREEEILKALGAAYGTDKYFEVLNELTGIFIMGVVSEKKIEFTLDASGMQYGCYGSVNGRVYISSHMRLSGVILGLETADYVTRLISYKWYHYMMGNYMPGDITCFDEFTRIIPNTYVYYGEKGYRVERFYPCREIQMTITDKEYWEVIEEGARVMKANMALIPMKWKRPAISLTGGIDSNTTFAAANGNYDKYETFSYISMYRESVDAGKAKEISDRFGIKHTVYQVPDSNDQVRDFDVYDAIFDMNDGLIGGNKDNDTRKKITLINNDVCDVEVKSWISETIRAYAYKYFGRTSFPQSLSPRDYTSLYKIFIGKRGLCRETDRYFEKYLENTSLKGHLYNYDESDFFVWEMMHGGKCGLNIGVMKACFDITIPYNNRKFLDTMLRVPLEKRLDDSFHLDMKKILNKELFDMNIRVVNLNETDRRKKMANLYYMVNSHLPF